MANTLGHADKRTAEQRRNDTAQKAMPKGAQDKTTVSTGPATGKEDERAAGTHGEHDSNRPKDGPGRYIPGNPGPGAQ